MAENNENLDSLNEEKTNLEEELNSLDPEKDKERISEITETVNSLNDKIEALEEEDDNDEADPEELKQKNKELYARLKKAQGFELKDGKWVKKPVKPNFEKKPAVVPPKDADIDKLLDAKLEKRELEALDMSDELKKEVQTYAKNQGVSIKQALNSKYIKFLQEEEDRKERTNNASLGGSSRGSRSKKDYSEVRPATSFNMTTPEGRADFAKYREAMKQKMG